MKREFAHQVQQAREINDETVTLYSFSTSARTDVNGNAQAVTTIPFWHSMEGELGKEVNSLVQRLTPKTRITKLYRLIKATTKRV